MERPALSSVSAAAARLNHVFCLLDIVWLRLQLQVLASDLLVDLSARGQGNHAQGTGPLVRTSPRHPECNGRRACRRRNITRADGWSASELSDAATGRLVRQALHDSGFAAQCVATIFALLICCLQGWYIRVGVAQNASIFQPWLLGPSCRQLVE